jgi:hypothetical protein
MTRDEFCSMERGDIVSAVGNGTCLIGGTYQEDGLTKVYFRTLPIDCIIVGITEEDCGMFYGLSKRPQSRIEWRAN